METEANPTFEEPQPFSFLPSLNTADDVAILDRLELSSSRYRLLRIPPSSSLLKPEWLDALEPKAAFSPKGVKCDSVTLNISFVYDPLAELRKHLDYLWNTYTSTSVSTFNNDKDGGTMIRDTLFNMQRELREKTAASNAVTVEWSTSLTDFSEGKIAPATSLLMRYVALDLKMLEASEAVGTSRRSAVAYFRALFRSGEGFTWEPRTPSGFTDSSTGCRTIDVAEFPSDGFVACDEENAAIKIYDASFGLLSEHEMPRFVYRETRHVKIDLSHFESLSEKAVTAVVKSLASQFDRGTDDAWASGMTFQEKMQAMNLVEYLGLHSEDRRKQNECGIFLVDLP
jgi:hypothetical protein